MERLLLSPQQIRSITDYFIAHSEPERDRDPVRASESLREQVRARESQREPEWESQGAVECQREIASHL